MARRIGIGLGIVLIALGLAVLASDWAGAGAQGFRMTATGEWWFWASPTTIQVAQPAIERHLHPSIWEYGIQPLLEWPLALELFVLGGVFLIVGSWRRGRRRR